MLSLCFDCFPSLKLALPRIVIAQHRQLLCRPRNGICGGCERRGEWSAPHPLPVLKDSPCPFCSCSLSEEQHPELLSPATALLGMLPAERYGNVPSGDDVQHDASCWLLLKCKSRQGAVGLTAAAGGSEHDSRSVRRSANLLRVTALIERGKSCRSRARSILVLPGLPAGRGRAAGERVRKSAPV